ncbi:hypothetical protein IGI04_026762 [Brassica rapa subsp. trilocularis]|uniref:Uncharacterized protein n=1 Tax=Brassica rapa subsp. trilocularis TaxID=1813537 RepID=A0ABQ7KZJ7_BRACM|nr:hypothetical protein IGI04_026762 [Brassica rapa subsp. trilocularis]
MFFACPYSYNIWDRVAGKLIGQRINPDWSIYSNGLGSHSLTFSIGGLPWRERNLRRHQQGQNGTEHMISMVNKVVKNMISSLGYKADHRLEGLLRR